jgi:hypothetical protein
VASNPLYRDGATAADLCETHTVNELSYNDEEPSGAHSDPPDDGEATVDALIVEVDLEPETGLEDGDGLSGSSDVAQLESSTNVTYDAGGLSGNSLTTFDSLLSSEDIPHVWQGAELTVPQEFEARVDALLDEVMVSAEASLDPSRDRVAYSVSAWSAAMEASLEESLLIAGIPFEWDEVGDLAVYAEDEERVDEILDEMPDPDDPDATDADTVDVQDLLGFLWEAASKLSTHPDDAHAVLTMVDSSATMEHLATPFGFDAPVWRDLASRCKGFVEVLESEDVEDGIPDEEIAEMARDLAGRIHRYI